jgi:hypothetical protein
MTENELEDFTSIWMAACENSGFKTEPSDAAINLAFDVLQSYTITDISMAIVKHQRMQNQPLTPGLIESLIAGITWLTPEEAWTIGQKTFDDGVSVVLTDEIAEAANVAKKLYCSGQKSNAKDSFSDVYQRLMIKAVSINKKPRWFLMQADDCFNRISENKKAITEAMQNGYISNHKAMQLAESFGVEVQSSLTNLIDAAPNEKTRCEIKKLKNMFIEGGNNG